MYYNGRSAKRNRFVENKSLRNGQKNVYLGRKIHKKPYLNLVKEGFVRLCECSSLHGFKYITDKSKTIGERIIWTTFCLSSLIVCIIYIYSSWQRWVSVPFNLMLDKHYTPIYDIPFPTVVICPINAVMLSYINLETATDRTSLFAASVLCDRMHPHNYSMVETDDYGPNVDEKIINFLSKSTPSCSEVIKKCKWKSSNNDLEEYDCCKDLFRSYLTDNGMCFVFNMAKLNDFNKTGTNVNRWDPEYGYESDLKRGSYPKRTYGVEKDLGLTVELYFNSSNSQYICGGSDSGYKILLNHPYDSIMLKNYATLPMNRLSTFSITPTTVSTDLNMRGVDPSIRKCFFGDEKKLDFHDYYTQTSCINECEMAHVIKTCRCASFYFYKTKNIPQDLPICKFYRQYKCMMWVKARVNSMWMSSHYKKKLGNQLDNDVVKSKKIVNHDAGNCLPNCAELIYDLETFYSNPYNDETEKSISEKPKSKSYETASVHVNFKNVLFMGIHRELSYQTAEFVGAVGGVLSLFLGFSIMSFIEVIYYIVFKPLWIVFSRYNQIHVKG